METNRLYSDIRGIRSECGHIQIVPIKITRLKRCISCILGRTKPCQIPCPLLKPFTFVNLLSKEQPSFTAIIKARMRYKSSEPDKPI